MLKSVKNTLFQSVQESRKQGVLICLKIQENMVFKSAKNTLFQSVKNAMKQAENNNIEAHLEFEMNKYKVAHENKLQHLGTSC